MKKKILGVALLLGSLLLSCTGNPGIQISGTVRNTGDYPIVYFQSVDGMFNSQTCDTLQINPDSTYTLTLPAEQYKRLRFVLWGEKELGSVIITHKDRVVEINLDGAADQSISIPGLSEQESARLAAIDRLNTDVWNLRTWQGDRWGIADDTVASKVAAILKADALAMDEQLKGARPDLYKKLQQDVRMQLMLAYQNQMMVANYRCSDATKQEWQREWEEMSAFCSVNAPDSPYSLAFYDVARNNSGLAHMSSGAPRDPKIDPDRVFFRYCEEDLSGKAQEAAMAQIFLQDQAEERNNPDITTLFDRFRELYPESAWMPMVEEAIAKNRAFNEAEAPAYIHFPEVEGVETFAEIIERYRGKVLYLDIWATWCGPCRSSFAHVKPLQDYVRTHDDVALLYLSLDRDEEDAKFRKMAVHYDLMGDHIRVQEAFSKEVYRTFGDKNGNMTVPRYVIFDKNGAIRYAVAASPKEMETLKSQLEAAANEE